MLSRTASLLVPGARALSRANYKQLGSALVQPKASFRQFSSLPVNLQLADPVVLEAPKVTVASSFAEEEYYFPPLNVAKSAPVITFNKPGQFAAEAATLSEQIFGVAIRRDIVHEVIRYQRHKKRQPKKTKRKSEIAGSNKKPRPQKGGGVSQAGHKRNSVWRKGQKAHGPVLRDYSIGMNRKVRAMGMMIALAAKLREGNFYVFDQINCETHRTKDLNALLRDHGLSETSVLIIDDDFQELFLKASSNIPSLTAMLQTKANVYDIVKREKLAVSAAALQNLQGRILAQYTYAGRRRALLRDLDAYAKTAASAEEEVEEGGAGGQKVQAANA